MKILTTLSHEKCLHCIAPHQAKIRSPVVYLASSKHKVMTITENIQSYCRGPFRPVSRQADVHNSRL